MSGHSDSDGMGSNPASPDARNLPLLLCQERFNEASLPDRESKLHAATVRYVTPPPPSDMAPSAAATAKHLHQICYGKTAQAKTISKFLMGSAHFSSSIFKMPQTRRPQGGGRTRGPCCRQESLRYFRYKNQLGPTRKSTGFS